MQTWADLYSLFAYVLWVVASPILFRDIFSRVVQRCFWFRYFYDSYSLCPPGENSVAQ